MNLETKDRRAAVDALVDEYRASCLWFLRADYYPRSEDEIRRVLDQIAAHGDVIAFQKVSALRSWPSLSTSTKSVA